MVVIYAFSESIGIPRRRPCIEGSDFIFFFMVVVLVQHVDDSGETKTPTSVCGSRLQIYINPSRPRRGVPLPNAVVSIACCVVELERRFLLQEAYLFFVYNEESARHTHTHTHTFQKERSHTEADSKSFFPYSQSLEENKAAETSISEGSSRGRNHISGQIHERTRNFC